MMSKDNYKKYFNFDKEIEKAVTFTTENEGMY